MFLLGVECLRYRFMCSLIYAVQGIYLHQFSCSMTQLLNDIARLFIFSPFWIRENDDYAFYEIILPPITMRGVFVCCFNRMHRGYEWFSPMINEACSRICIDGRNLWNHTSSGIGLANERACNAFINYFSIIKFENFGDFDKFHWHINWFSATYSTANSRNDSIQSFLEIFFFVLFFQALSI